MSVTSPHIETEQDVDAEEAEAHQPHVVGVVAEFEQPATLMSAAAKIRDAGYTRWDTYTPFPIHGLDEAMGIRPTFLPWLVLAGGLTGTALAVGLQWYTNASEWSEFAFGWPWSGYQYPISGKPYWSLPANIPIAFELTVLLASFAAFFGMLGLNRLVQWHSPLFKVERFKKVTDNRFFVSIDARDPKFDVDGIAEYLRRLGAGAVDECWENESRRIPGRFFSIGLVVFALALVPPVLVMWHRGLPFSTPRLHPVTDMDFQAKFKSQQGNPFFADNRAMRPHVPGTVARTSDPHVGDVRYHLGINPGQAMASLQDEGTPSETADGGGAGGDGNNNPQRAPRPDGAADDTGDESEQSADGQVPEDPPAGMNENQDWVETIPIPVTEKLMARGREQFGIYCAPCHGFGGYGDGVVNQRASALRQPTWVPVASLHTPQTRNRPDGYIFRAITEGVRKMPSYGDQIEVHDRWAIVAYVRALQRSQGASAQSGN